MTKSWELYCIQRAFWELKHRRQPLSLLWELLHEVKEESGYVQCFAKKISRYSECQKLLSKKTKHLKLMILAFFSVWENVNTCSSILFLSILNPLSVHSQGVEEEEVHDFNGWLLESSSILWYGRGHFLSTNRWGGSKKMTIHRPAKEPPPQGNNSGSLSWASSLQDYEMNIC